MLLLFMCATLDLCHSSTLPYNILFVVADDLRADLGGYYGQQNIIYTPNLDAFQSRAFTFTHAYTQQAICAATRASFLTGTRPDTTRVWNIGPYFRERMINNTGKTVITLPQYFKQNGYYTVGSGKIFHPGSASGYNATWSSDSCNLGNDMPYSWSETYWDCDQNGNGEVNSPAQNNCANPEGCTQSKSCLNCLAAWNCYFANGSKTSAVCPSDCPDNCYNDWDIATNTLKYFENITQNGTNQPSKPFFIGVGLKRPHLLYHAPLRYYEQYGYNQNYSNIPIAKYTTIPQNAPIKASNNDSIESSDVEPYVYDVPYLDPATDKNGTLSYINVSYHPNLRGSYYATVAFLDAQFGRVIQGLYEYGLWNNTIVLFTGDHGYHLGEQGCWTKMTVFELATRVPLIIRIPGMNEGQKSDLLVEQLDMFPTLIDATIGFKEEVMQQLEGKSLLNVIKDPSFYKDYYAYSQYPRGGEAPNFNVMGLSIRTSEWRYSEWVGWNAGSNISKPFPIWNQTYGVELYNHSNSTMDENDFNAYDNYNLAYDENMQHVVQQMHQLLYQTWDNQSWAINRQYRQHAPHQ